MSEFIKLVWLEHDGNDPILFYIEYGKDGYEVRRIEIFEDGSIFKITEETEDEDHFLSCEPKPDLDAINDPPNLFGTKVTKREFEALWQIKIA